MKTDAFMVLRKAGVSKKQAEIISEGSKLKGCAAYDFVKNNKEKIGEITELQQLSLFKITYLKLEGDVKRISKDKRVIKKYHPDKNVTSKDAWERIPKKIKEILIDLRYRGDYTQQARDLLQSMAYTGDLAGFGRVLSNRSFWPDVPQDRFTRRVNFYENN